MPKTYTQLDYNWPDKPGFSRLLAQKDGIQARADCGGFWILQSILGIQNLTRKEPSNTIVYATSTLCQKLRMNRKGLREFLERIREPLGIVSKVRLETSRRVSGGFPEISGNLPGTYREPTREFTEITLPKSLIYQERRSRDVPNINKNRYKREIHGFTNPKKEKQPIKIDKGLNSLFSNFNKKYGTKFKQGDDGDNQ